jgi:hypothetical protein
MATNVAVTYKKYKFDIPLRGQMTVGDVKTQLQNTLRNKCKDKTSVPLASVHFTMPILFDIKDDV